MVNFPNVPTLSGIKRDRIERMIVKMLSKYGIPYWAINFNSVWKTIELSFGYCIKDNCIKQLSNNIKAMGMDITIY